MEKTQLNRKGKPLGCKSHPELYLLFQMGLSPKDVIKMNLFKTGMVYRYHKKYQVAKAEIAKIMLKQGKYDSGSTPTERGGLEPD